MTQAQALLAESAALLKRSRVLLAEFEDLARKRRPKHVTWKVTN